MKMVVLMGLLLLSMAQLKLTLQELQKFDGSNGTTYLACGGLIFDVSDSPTYGPKGSYRMFAGHDVSVSLAKMSFDKSYIDMPISEANLSEGHYKSIQSWKEFYLEKYPVVGELIEKPHSTDM